MPTKPLILWFRRDLRLRDNPALAAAIEQGRTLIPVYVHDASLGVDWAPGAASKVWLHAALHHLDQDLRRLGGQLILRSGESREVLQELIKETGAAAVYWNRRYDPAGRELDAGIKRHLIDMGVEAKSFNSALLNEPHTVSSKVGEPYKVYTPYFKAARQRRVELPCEPDYWALCFCDTLPQSESLDRLGLSPCKDWAGGMMTGWDPSEQGALGRVKAFAWKASADYDVDRDRPDLDGTSCMSPYLHFGQIGPRQIVEALDGAYENGKGGAFVYLKELYWREFAYHVLYHFPHTVDRPLRPEYADFPWEGNREHLRRWQLGQTGYPIIDAGMRQLWQTGWMHNRVRMIVASFLVKHLLQDWKAGARWFWDTLVDADLASNTLGWQWSGGCGADAAPYFRVFNPIIQGKKFDPDGAYVKRYVPELANLPASQIHTPWEVPSEVLSALGVRLGENYPYPVIEHSEGRARALGAFEQFRAVGV